MEKKKKGFKMPHTFVILIACILLVAIGTYLIPAGTYDRVEMPDGRMVVDADSFTKVEQNPTGFFDLFKSIPNGMVAAADIIFFIFIVGGCFAIVMATGALQKGIGRLALAAQGKEKMLIPIVMAIFALGGSTFGMTEECIAFIPLGVALARAIGYDAVVGAAMVILGAACGFTAGFMNPFTVGVAQGIAELPLFSGIPMRIVIWFIMIIITSLYVLRYAGKVKGDPKLSLVADLEVEEKHKAIDLSTAEKMGGRDIAIVLTVVVIMAVLVYGVFKYGWYLTEICALFVIMGVIAGFLGGFGPSRIATEFVAGAKDIVFGALVVGVARAILVVMENGMIIDSVVHALASVIAALPKSIAAIGMYVVQVIINFFIPSGSGQAAATMPIMTPLADVIGLTRQTAVLAYQFGDGFTNSIIPTSAALMANLSVAKIPYEKWVKFITPLMGIWIVTGAIFMVIATVMNYGPF